MADLSLDKGQVAEFNKSPYQGMSEGEITTKLRLGRNNYDTSPINMHIDHINDVSMKLEEYHGERENPTNKKHFVIPAGINIEDVSPTYVETLEYQQMLADKRATVEKLEQ